MITADFLINSLLLSIIDVPTLFTIFGAIFAREWRYAVLWAFGAAALGAIKLQLFPDAMDQFLLRVIGQIVVASFVWFIACHARRIGHTKNAAHKAELP